MRDILDMMEKSILVIDKKGIIQYANPEFYSDQWGMEEKPEGQNINEIYVCDASQEMWTKVFEENTGKEIKVLCLKGKSSGQMLRVQILQKMWERKKAYFFFIQDAYKLNDDAVRQIFGQFPYIMWVKNREGKYCFVSDQFLDNMEKNTKLTRKDNVIGKMDEQIWDESMCQAIRSGEREVLENKSSIIYQQVIRRKDEDHGCTFYMRPVLDNNKQVNFIVESIEDSAPGRRIENGKKIHPNQKGSIHRYIGNYVDANNQSYIASIDELDCIKANLRKKLKADGLLITLFSEDQMNSYIICKDGTMEEEFRYASQLPNQGYWTYTGIENWGVFSKETMKQHCDMQIVYQYQQDYKYTCVYPIYVAGNLIGILLGVYKDTKPDEQELSKWIESACNYIGNLIGSKILTNVISNEIKEKTESELQYVIDIAADLTAIMAPDGKLRRIGPTWEKQLGWKAEELLGKPFLRFVYYEDQEDVASAGYRRQRERKEGSCRMICKDGSYKWFEYKVQYIESIRGVVYTARDITEKMKREREEKISRQAQEAKNIREEIFTNISHEFRTPINIILTSVQLLGIIQDQDTQIQPEKFEKYADKIKHNGMRLLRLSNNLIELSRLDISKPELKLGNIEMVSAVKSVIMAADRYFNSSNIQLSFEATCEQAYLVCDIQKIEKCILNLISNGVKYGGRDKVVKLEIKVKERHNYIDISVKDHGRGIQEDQRKYIFERFMQLDTSFTRPAEGCGMGLALTKAYVEMHKGIIDVVSEEGQGAEFIIRLPKDAFDGTGMEKSQFRSRIETCTVELSDIYF